MKHFEFNWKTRDDLLIYAQGWRPGIVPRAVICLVHGLGEHSGRYVHLASILAQAGYALLSFDLRGHGRSEGVRGHTANYKIMMEDISHFLKAGTAEFSGSAILLYGHSMGGNLVINYALRNQPKIEGVIATSPWLKLTFEPPGWKMRVGKVLCRLWPGLSMSNGLDLKGLSHDFQVIKEYRDDPWVHDRITPRLSVDMVNSGVWAMEHAAEFPLPLLLMHGGSDIITSPQASREFAEQMGSHCSIKIWEGLLHEIHNEPEKGEVFNYLLEWVEKLLV